MSDSYCYFGAEYCVNFFQHFHSPDVYEDLQQLPLSITDDDDSFSCQSNSDSSCTQNSFDAASSFNCCNAQVHLPSAAAQHNHSHTDKTFGPAPFYNVKVTSSDDNSDGDNDDGSEHTKKLFITQSTGGIVANN
jgi:hypothetical protein